MVSRTPEPRLLRLRLILRGLLGRCPRCGSGQLFVRYFTLKDACPRCGLTFQREEGYWVGAMTLNIILAEALFVAIVAVGIILTWPDLPVVPLIVIGVAANIAFPILFYPLSKTLWLGVDLAYFHRLRPEDFR
jgi:uncharacterized protein (DUF983 family)